MNGGSKCTIDFCVHFGKRGGVLRKARKCLENMTGNCWLHGEQICLVLLANQEVIALLRENKQGNYIDNFPPYIWKTQISYFLQGVLTRRLVLIVHSLISDVQICTIPNKSINSFYLLQYIIVKVSNETGLSGDLTNLDQRNVDRVDHQYLEITFQKFGLVPIQRLGR